MRNVGVHFLVIIFIIAFTFYIIYGKVLTSEKEVNIVNIKTKEIKKEEYTGEYMEIMIKNPSKLSSYLNQYNISDLKYEVNWDKEFILMTYPFEISKCTFSLANDKDNFHVMDIIYNKTSSCSLYIYVIKGKNFITWEATGANKDIRFE